MEHSLKTFFKHFENVPETILIFKTFLERFSGTFQKHTAPFTFLECFSATFLECFLTAAEYIHTVSHIIDMSNCDFRTSKLFITVLSHKTDRFWYKTDSLYMMVPIPVNNMIINFLCTMDFAIRCTYALIPTSESYCEGAFYIYMLNK